MDLNKQLHGRFNYCFFSHSHRYKDTPKFGLGFTGDLTHADNNPGQYIDKDLKRTLRWLKDNGHFENTLLIVMGDHGARYSKVRW